MKQRLYVENLLSIPIPVLTRAEQLNFASEREKRLDDLSSARQRLDVAVQEVEDIISGKKMLPG